MKALVDFRNIEAVLTELAYELQTKYKENLQQSGRYTTERKLLDSVRTEVVTDSGGWSVTMHLEDYWKWVEDDTRPHFPPISAILRWVEIKPIVPRPFADGRIPTPQSLAFLIARKISRVGTTGSHDLQRAKSEVIPRYQARLRAALTMDISAYLEEVMSSRNF